MKDKETLIDRIIREKLIINKANLEYCAKNEVINGSLLQSIREAMQAYHEAKMKEVTTLQTLKGVRPLTVMKHGIIIPCISHGDMIGVLQLQ
jgi:hypothetical protein